MGKRVIQCEVDDYVFELFLQRKSEDQLVYVQQVSQGDSHSYPVLKAILYEEAIIPD